MKLTLAEIAEAMEAVGDLSGQEGTVFSKVQTDSRLARPGELFACLQGEHFDGHAFVQHAVRKGVRAVVAERPLDAFLGVPVLYVKDTLEALGKLASFWRARFKGQVIGITGSAGKTTTKECLAQILSQKGKTAKNYRNYNNQLGVPLSILGFSGQEKFWTLEAGISLPGEMDHLGAILCPDLIVITNVGPVHLQGLGSIQGVAREKLKLVSWLQPGGQVVTSLDYPELADFDYQVPAAFFSTHRKDALCSGRYLGPNQRFQGVYRLLLAGQEMEVVFPYSGEFFLENLMASALTAHLQGMAPEQIRAGLQGVRLPEHRCAMRFLGALLLLDDCYNANPLSMGKSLQHARELAGQRPLFLILGEMRELGPDAPRLHRELGLAIAKVHPDNVFYYGKFAQEVRAGMMEDGFLRCPFAELQDVEDFRQAWIKIGATRGVVLVKGSRGCKLERFVTVIEEGV